MRGFRVVARLSLPRWEFSVNDPLPYISGKMNISTKKKLQWTFQGILVLAILGGVTEFLIHHYDPTRVLYKRLKADDEYVYEKIDPKFLKIDPRSLISVETLADVRETRARLIDVFWGDAGFPADVQPSAIERTLSSEAFSDLPNLARIDRLTVDMGHEVRSKLLYLHPAENRNGNLVIYHHGYAGTIEDVPHIIGAFLERGYAVLAMNLMAYGENSTHFRTREGEAFNLHIDLDKIETPMRYHLEPVVVGINYALRVSHYGSVKMVGFSAGGFVTTVMAAVDSRIRQSYLVAGVYPIYLRTGQDIQNGLPSYYAPMLEVANYMDMFVLGAAGPGRRQLQVFNRYDRCCFNNTKGKLYEPAIVEAVDAIDVGGGFAVLIDETHADHKISRFAVEAILDDMVRP